VPFDSWSSCPKGNSVDDDDERIKSPSGERLSIEFATAEQMAAIKKSSADTNA